MIAEHRVGIEPTSPLTRAVSWPLDDQCETKAEGGRLKDEKARCRFDFLLHPDFIRFSGAGGNRTHSGRLKVCCAAFTPRPREVGRAYAFQTPSASNHLALSLSVVFSVVALGIELSTARLSAEHGQPALDYRIESGTPESNPGLDEQRWSPPAPEAGVLPSAPLPDIQSERQDLNLGHRSAGGLIGRSWPPTRRDNQASLRSDQLVKVPRRGIEPPSAD